MAPNFKLPYKAAVETSLVVQWLRLQAPNAGGLGLMSGQPKTSLNIRKFMVHILLKPGLENFEHY